CRGHVISHPQPPPSKTTHFEGWGYKLSTFLAREFFLKAELFRVQAHRFIPLDGVDAKHVEIADDPGDHVEKEFEEGEHFECRARGTVDGHPAPQEDDLDIEQDEHDGDEIKLNGKTLSRGAFGRDTAFVGRHLVRRAL